ncbi:hypothetical protein Slin14017_G087740 [Septoria linicola]|nr:hypothetical protein Slin14017_G087740 [Septoria linicola]
MILQHYGTCPAAHANVHRTHIVPSWLARRAASRSVASQGSLVVNVPDPSWAITVAAIGANVQTSLWYDTAGQNYSDDLGILYDVCTFRFGNLPENTLRLAQDDDGRCGSTLSNECQAELRKRASNSAQLWTTYSSPPPYRNLTAGVLPTLCTYVQADLTNDDGTWPTQCSVELGNGQPGQGQNASISTMALTGFNESILDNGCSLTADSQRFSNVQTRLVPFTLDNYNLALTSTYPVLSVYFSVANAERTSSRSVANSTLSCLRARDVSEGSVTAPALPSGTPLEELRAKASLSGGTIAGIVIGVVAGVVLLAGAVFWFFMRRRKQKRARTATMNMSEPTDEKDLPAQADGNAVQELHSYDKKPEIDSGELPELGDAQGKPGELYGEQKLPPGELYGSEVQR